MVTKKPHESGRDWPTHAPHRSVIETSTLLLNVCVVWRQRVN